MSEITFKQKYESLKSKFMESVDVSYRLGYEQGMKDAQVNQMQGQQQMAQQQAMQQQGAPGECQEPEGDEQQEQQDQQPMENPQGSELDQHIAKLESMLGKSELNADDLKKALSQLKEARELKKSHEAIKGIATALHKPKFKISQQANHNMSSSAKASLSLQEKIVNDVMKSWAEEEQQAHRNIGNALAIEGLTIKTE